ncbi:hypothetical protein AX17_001968 [Amanita inopinata Kibby_2008]|nr:hypothetical protein AX17_001968 [Amanita inopinata Kibby_2008]
MPAKHSRNGRSQGQPMNNSNPNLLSNTPPPHSPTPIPDADELVQPFYHFASPESLSNDSPAPTLSTLLDFDQPPTAAAHALPEVVEPEEDLVSIHRSPPFIQAPLPPVDQVIAKEPPLLHSPQPLPTRPRIAMNDGPVDASLSGHTRSPILAREQSTLESFSRTLRTYVPSSIHIPIPRSAPSPPLVSRPVSFGSFSASKDTPSQDVGAFQHGRHEFERQSRTSANYHARAKSYALGTAETTGSGVARALQVDRYRDTSRERLTQPLRGMSYPGSDATHADPILWARWDRVNDRRLLILAYPSGFQLWDCTDLGSVTEVLNLNVKSPEWLGGGEIVHVSVLPSPSSQTLRQFGDPLAGDRPLLGIVLNLNGHRDSSTLFIYSLSRQYLIQRVPITGLVVTFISNPHFLVISTTNPPTLQIYSPTTFKEIYTIASNSLVPFAHSPVSYSNLTSKLFSAANLNNNNKSNEPVFLGTKTEDQRSQSSPLVPVFALSHRLLAFASPPSTSTQQAQRVPSSGSGHSSANSLSSSPFGFTGLNMQITQAELGTAAMKVGGTLLSGMKTLGGIALSAAKNRIMTASTGGGDALGPELRRSPRKYVSTSAPSAANLDPGEIRERRYSSTSMGSQESTGRSYSGSDQAHPSPVMPNTSLGPENGSYVTILDLAPLLMRGTGTGGNAPVVIAEFFTSRTQPVAALKFSQDGCNIVVVPMNGQVLQVYQVRPRPATSRHASSTEAVSSDQANPRTLREAAHAQDAVSRMYNLHRGRSQAVVDDVLWAHDGRWIAIGTQRPTIHVFAINPYGGRPDLRSHTKGKVMNANELQPASVDIGPLARLRAIKPPSPEQPKPTLAFTFIESSESCLPSSLLPTPSVPLGELGSNPHHRSRPTNFQDLLVFDPNDGMLSLRRITSELRSKDQGLSVAASMSALGTTSISLPGLGGAGKLSSSPSSVAHSTSVASNASGQQRNIESTHELVGKETIVATWNLQRRRDWEEIRQPIIATTTLEVGWSSRRLVNLKSSYLARAELSTFSRSPQILPRSVYLSHQFSFYNLGEDYHALIRRSYLDITGQKIEVRKEVEVSAFPSGPASEAFVEDFSSPRDSRRHSTSFDEPLANALSGGLEYTAAPPILPMYPNGAPGSRPRSFRNSIPIRTIGDGMSESLSRLRREINKVRSPHLLPCTETSSSPGLVPLEFDEEDEDFLSRDMRDGSEQGGEGEGEGETSTLGAMAATVILESAPATGVSLSLIDESTDDGMSGWDLQDRQAIEEEERFQDLAALGVLEEGLGGEMGVSGKPTLSGKKGRGRRR